MLAEPAIANVSEDPELLPPPSLYVDANASPSGDGSLDLPFQTIQAALNAATNESVILVKAGTYSGVSNRNLSFGDKNLVLSSDKGWEQTILDNGSRPNTAFVFNSGNANARVSGFTITAGSVLCLDGSAPTFVNCSFTSNSSPCFRITNASPAILNCRFFNNSSPAVIASGASTASVSHCTFVQNAAPKDGGNIYSANGAHIVLHNSILWHAAANAGAGIVTNGGTVAANYCDVRGGYTGDGNIDIDPQFETGGTRLRSTSQCIDHAAPQGLPGLSLFTRFDMDGEVRLHPDIGADEFVYRIQFPTHQGIRWLLADGTYTAETNSFSEVDEASGVAFLGTNATGPLISIVDDEDRDTFHLYQLNAAATTIVKSHAIPLLNPLYRNDRGQQEMFDMEGLTFDAITKDIYIVTSQSKRNRYRDVDSSPPIVDPVIDPPCNDYDRRRAMIVRVKLDNSLTKALRADFFEPEQVPAPKNTGYEPIRGLAAHMRQSFTNSGALGDATVTNRVLIARNTVNKFGRPANGIGYPAGASLPYTSGGTSFIAGISLGEFSGTTGLHTNSGLLPKTSYYYKIWAIDAHTNYTAGVVASTRTDGVPRLFINELLGTGDPDWLELYNPAHTPVSLAGLEISHDGVNFVPLPANTTVPGRGFVRLFANGRELPFKLAKEGNVITLRRRSPAAEIDRYQYMNQDDGITEGRVWDAGSRGLNSATHVSEGARFRRGSSYPPTRLARDGGPTNNHARPLKRFIVTPDVHGTTNYLEWSDVGMLPPVWTYSPKQHDFHAVNVEDIAYRSGTEMIIGLRAPLVNRTNGNAYFFVVTNVAAFLPASKWTRPLQGISEARQMALGGMGIRSIKWCPNGLTNAHGQPVERYLVLAGNANGGPLQREATRQKFSLYAWNGATTNGVAIPQLLIADLNGYTVRPEGIELISAAGQWRILFVEDRFLASGYGTRNAVHWPLSILGPIP